MHWDRGLEIHHDGDLPARSGMGSSSSFAVGLLHALHALQGRMLSKEEMTREAMRIEQEVLREAVGSQDQTVAAHGGFNLIQFESNGEIIVRPVIVPGDRLQELNQHLLLFFTGHSRISSQVAAGYVTDLAAKQRQLETYRQMVDEALAILSSNRPLKEFGLLMHEAWKIKRTLSKDVSNDEIDGHYEAALKAGAFGGKLLGAGGGGFLLVFAPPESHPAIIAKLNHLLEIPFRFESGGSQVVFYERQIDYSQKDKARLSQKLRPFTEAPMPPSPKS